MWTDILRVVRSWQPAILQPGSRTGGSLFDAVDSRRTEDIRDIEATLGTVRAIVAVALFLLPSSTFGPEVWGKLLYLTYAVTIRLAFVVGRPSSLLGRTPSFQGQITSQAIDFVVATLSVFFLPAQDPTATVLFLLVFLSAAIRWGGGATLCCVAIATLVLTLDPPSQQPISRLAADVVNPRRQAILGIGYLMVAGGLFSSLGFAANRRRAERAMLTQLRDVVGLEKGFRRSLYSLLYDVTRLFDARGVEVTLHDSSSGRTYRWELHGSDEPESALRCYELAEQNTNVASAEARMGFGDTVAPRWESTFHIAGWSGAVALLEPLSGFGQARRIQLFQGIVRDITPALHDVYSLARVRSRALALERSRLARQIHDGVIQSLVGVELQMSALARGPYDEALRGHLTRLRNLMRAEILNLRDLMLHTKPLDIGSEELPDVLADLVDRFALNSGIAVTFVREPGPIGLSRRTASECVRIVQEGLANLRKHSGARRGTVSLTPTPSGVMISIEDEGRGFPFDGRVYCGPEGTEPQPMILPDAAAAISESELQRARRPLLPAAIRESAQALGGELIVESRPGKGARLEVRLPSATREGPAHRVAS